MKQDILIVGPVDSEGELIKLAKRAVKGREIVSQSHSVSSLPVNEGQTLREFFRMIIVVKENKQ